MAREHTENRELKTENPSVADTARLRLWLVRLGSFALAGGLLYLALRGVDFGAMAEALRRADYRWLAPLVGLALLSHTLRAWRWTVLLDALPADPRGQADALPADAHGHVLRRASLKTAFYSLMIGYMVNYVTPRLGELVRTGNQALQEDRSFGGVLGTVVAERVLDVLMLALALASTLALLAHRFSALDALFFAPARQRLEGLPLGLGLLALAGVLALGGLLALLAWRSARARGLWHTRLAPLLTPFRDGLATVLRTGRPAALVGSTLAIWACYALMAYCPLAILNLAAPYDLGLVDAWELMALGSLGLLVPSPGGLGSYHYVTIEALVHLFGVPEAAAATYAVLTHGVQLVLYVLAGGLCLVLQGIPLRALWRVARRKQDAS